MEIVKLFNELKCIIDAREALEEARFSERFFTRDRKMPFTEILKFFFDMRKTSLQTRLNNYFKGDIQNVISEQAFSKARNNFDHSPFEKMVRRLVEVEYQADNATNMYHGYHILAVDGSYLQLPKTEKLKAEFGTRGQGKTCVSAGISVLYDVLSGFPIDPAIGHSDMNERKECERHIEFISENLPHVAGKSIVLLDRGYPSVSLFEKFGEKGMLFLARCAKNYCKATENAPMGESFAKLEGGFRVRVYKFTLPGGETETLVTNADMSGELLPELYAMRWGIEGAYNVLKNVVCVEKFSGKTPNAIRQDFWASMVLMISVAVFKADADGEIEKRQQRKFNKHKYKTRLSDLVVTLRDAFVFETLIAEPDSFDKIKDIIALIAYSASPVRPGRSFTRNPSLALSVNSQLKSHL